MSGQSLEGVNLEVKKNGQSITKLASGKNGKYSIQMEISTTNTNNEYLLYISKEGTVPKTLSINTYISPEEFARYSYARYSFDLEVKMQETTEKDIIVEKPAGKIIWNAENHRFSFDQSYAKIIQREEKAKEEPEKALKELAEKKKKEEEELAQKKADEEKKRLADLKSKEEADKILQQNLKAMKLEMKRKRIQDSLDKAAAEAKKFIEPVSAENVDPNAFDGSGAYSINIAQKSQRTFSEKMRKVKAANLSTKYETNNILTSLLDVVDEHDKSLKKSQKQ